MPRFTDELGKPPRATMATKCNSHYYMTLMSLATRDSWLSADVLVGRIRKDLGHPSGRSISMLASADRLLKEAASGTR
jgi:aspartate-semialdehyde dehydrogenase